MGAPTKAAYYVAGVTFDGREGRIDGDPDCVIDDVKALALGEESDVLLRGEGAVVDRRRAKAFDDVLFLWGDRGEDFSGKSFGKLNGDVPDATGQRGSAPFVLCVGARDRPPLPTR